MSKDPRSNWDAPADGDFASYVERLGALQAPTPAPPAASPLGLGRRKTAQNTAAALATEIELSDLTPAEALSAAGLTEKLRSVRLLFLLVLVGQVLLLLFFQKGSLPLLFFTGIIWVMLGRARSTLALPTANSANSANTSNGGDAAKNIHLQRLREQLKRSVRERVSSQKK